MNNSMYTVLNRLVRENGKEGFDPMRDLVGSIHTGGTVQPTFVCRAAPGWRGNADG